MAVGVETCEDRSDRWRRLSAWSLSVSEAQALRCEAVYVGRSLSLIASAGEVISPEGVYDDEEDIGSLRRAPTARERERDAAKEPECA